MAKRPRRIRVDDLPSDVLKRITRDATAQAGLASLNPKDPLRSIRALGVIGAAYGLAGEVDEETLSLRLYESGEPRVVIARADLVEDILAVAMEENRALRAELQTLRSNIFVLAAAWSSNANNDPDPEAAKAWRHACSALDDLLDAD